MRDVAGLSPYRLPKILKWSFSLLTPPRQGWLFLFSTPTTYLLWLGLLATAVAKIHQLLRLEDFRTGVSALAWSIAPDAALYCGLSVVLLAIESRSPRIRMVTILLACTIAFTAVANAIFLMTAGDQLTVEALQYGYQSRDVVLPIISELLGKHIGLILVLLSTIVAIPLLIGKWKQRPHTSWTSTAHCSGTVMLISSLICIVVPTPEQLVSSSLGHNVLAASIWSALSHEPIAEETYRNVPNPSPGKFNKKSEMAFSGFDSEKLVSAEDIRALTQRDRPNVVILVLESTRFDATSLGGRSNTPNLLALSRQGTSAPVARAVLPHTSKSLFSLHCGRIPTMQYGNIEAIATVSAQCLPKILSEAGYRTAFMQSATGTFEDRPRLATLLGFDQFEASEELGGELQGYLSSADASLGPAFERWLDAGPEPFQATVLTSGTHFPYGLPERYGDASSKSDEERYLWLVEEEDRLLGTMLQALDARGLRERTLLVVVGDHGEGFGAKTALVHDNNFWEEGLRVPMVFAGPGVPAAGTFEGNVSMTDVTPTVMHLLGLPFPPLEIAGYPMAFNLMDGAVPSDVPRFFACLLPAICRGLVIGNDKILYFPASRRFQRYDLQDDPKESKPLELLPEHFLLRQKIQMAVASHRTERNRGPFREIRPYGRWSCPPDSGCTHPDYVNFEK